MPKVSPFGATRGATDLEICCSVGNPSQFESIPSAAWFVLVSESMYRREVETC
jgi:hypothetical protein